MEENNLIQERIANELMTVIDPETGENVIRMRLVRDLSVDSDGKVHYIFRPSSPLCPIAVPLAAMILRAIENVPGVTGQDMTVEDYIEAEMLNDIIKSIYP